MNSDRLNKLTESFFRDVWGARQHGLLSTIDLSRIKDSDVEFLLKQYPFLQIISTDPALPENASVKLLPAKSGWVIHDYGDVLCASPGQLLYGDDSVKEGDDERRGGVGSRSLTAGKGTIVNQAFMTAQEMIAIAIEQGWPGAEIIDGTPLMQWAAWMAAEDREYVLRGYEPSRVDKAKRARLRKAIPEITIGPKPGLGRR